MGKFLSVIVLSLAASTVSAADLNHMPTLDDLDVVVANQKQYTDKHEKESPIRSAP